MRYHQLLLLCLFLHFTSFAGGVKGTVKNAQGEILPFASILIKENSKGTMANEAGQYELSLEKGLHTLVFQYLGHKPLEKVVSIDETVQRLDVVLQEQTVTLNEVRFSAKSEDPAYTIMRKTISMARFKVLELSTYTARTYLKGTAQVKEVSSLMKMMAGKKIEKELGLKIGQVYVMESINDILFKQPSSVSEKVVSARNNLPKQLESQGSRFITASRVNFYNPKIFGDVISPLSPSALAYYRFKFEGEFVENGRTIDRIRVIPKAKGENVFEGIINIIEDSWYIHSLDLKFAGDDYANGIKTIYAPFKEVWLPVSYTFHSDFDSFGFKGFFNYATTVRSYNVTVNEKYHQSPVVIDEKIDKAEAKVVKKEKVDAQTVLNQKQLTRKQLEKFLKKTEKADKKERKEQGEATDVVRAYSIEVDSLYKKRSDNFWNEERQIPLTELETKGYQQADSLEKVNEVAFKKDSIRNLPVFKLGNIITGKTYNYGKRDNLYNFYPRSLTYTSPISQVGLLDFVNTVDGYFVQAGLNYDTREKLTKRTSLYGTLRYAIGRKTLNWKLGYYYLKDYHSFEVSGGRFIQQFNENKPISTFANTLYTLLGEENYAKFYEKQYLNFQYKQRWSSHFTSVISMEYAERNALENTSTLRPWIDTKDKEFSSNTPQNVEMMTNNWVNPKSFVLDASVSIRPFAKTGVFNGREYVINKGNPTLTFSSSNGFSEANFNRLEASYEQLFELTKVGTFHVQATYGDYLKAPVYFSDFRHFNGNQTILRSFRFDAFRNLEYYLHSTRGNYLECFLSNDFDKFLLTQSNVLRLYGLKESIFMNVLSLPKQSFNYLEVGYGILGIGKLFGAEVVSSFVGGKYSATALRIKFNR